MAAKRSPVARPVHTADHPLFELRTSPIQGTGAFALTDIGKGTRIIEYTGEKITNREADRRYDDEKMERHHTFLFTLDARHVVDAAVGGNESRFINHSCDPNCEAVIERGRIYIDALKPIPAGAELTYDYAYERTADHTEEDEQLYVCRCGSPRCRGTILAPPAPRRKRRKAKRSKETKARRGTGPTRGAKTQRGTGSTRADKTRRGTGPTRADKTRRGTGSTRAGRTRRGTRPTRAGR